MVCMMLQRLYTSGVIKVRKFEAHEGELIIRPLGLIAGDDAAGRG